VTASALGNRRCVVVETNSCPSGQKSQPLVNDASEQARRGARGRYRAPALGSAHARSRGSLWVHKHGAALHCTLPKEFCGVVL